MAKLEKGYWKWDEILWKIWRKQTGHCWEIQADHNSRRIHTGQENQAELWYLRPKVKKILKDFLKFVSFLNSLNGPLTVFIRFSEIYIVLLRLHWIYLQFEDTGAARIFSRGETRFPKKVPKNFEKYSKNFQKIFTNIQKIFK